MVTDQDLWARLERLSLNDAAADFPFAARLARDNGWAHAYADRVIEEYKRFAYLAMVAGHEVTPSDEVDQAWHLHLTYTRHYWGPFTEALGARLHHGPTIGGASEDRRYRDNYDRTLESYRREFGKAPPADIWPSPEMRFGAAPHMRRLYVPDYILLPKRLVAKASGLTVFIAGLGSLFYVSASAANGGSTNASPAIWIALVAVAAALGSVFAITGAAKNASRNVKKSDGAGAGGAVDGGKGSDGGSDGGGSGCSGGSGCGGGGCGGGG